MVCKPELGSGWPQCALSILLSDSRLCINIESENLNLHYPSEQHSYTQLACNPSLFQHLSLIDRQQVTAGLEMPRILLSNPRNDTGGSKPDLQCGFFQWLQCPTQTVSNHKLLCSSKEVAEGQSQAVAALAGTEDLAKLSHNKCTKWPALEHYRA